MTLNEEHRLLLRGSEVAAMIGCSPSQAYKLMKQGVLPTLRVPGGKTVRVPADALRRWISENTQGGAKSAVHLGSDAA